MTVSASSGSAPPKELADLDASRNGQTAYVPIPPAASQVDHDLAWLERQSIQTLQDHWRRTFGRKAPPKLGAEFLKRALSYQIQEQQSGGLSRQAQIRLKAWSKGVRGNKEGSAGLRSVPLIKPGTRFVREWQSEMHEVLAIEAGDFVYKAKTYRSLTEIARAITGTHQSGLRFFGLGKWRSDKHG